MDEQSFKEILQIASDYSYKHDDWVCPLEEALHGVTAEDAAWRPGPDGKGIWDIVLHLAVWTENILERMRTGQRAHPVEGEWPAPPPVQDEMAWEAAKRRLRDALRHLDELMAASSLEQLAAGPFGLADLFCRFLHNAYHIGQIVKLREVREVQSR